MSVYALTPLAQADIFKIWSYIAKDNEDAAARVERAIYDSFEFIAEAPCAAMLGTTQLYTEQNRIPFRSSPFCMGEEISGVF